MLNPYGSYCAYMRRSIGHRVGNSYVILRVGSHCRPATSTRLLYLDTHTLRRVVYVRIGVGVRTVLALALSVVLVNAR